MISQRHDVEQLNVEHNDKNFDYDVERTFFIEQIKSLVQFCDENGIRDAKGVPFALIHVDRLKRHGDEILEQVKRNLDDNKKMTTAENLVTLNELQNELRSFEDKLLVRGVSDFNKIFSNSLNANYGKSVEIDEVLKRIKKNFAKEKHEVLKDHLSSIKSTLQIWSGVKHFQNREIERMYQAKLNEKADLNQAKSRKIRNSIRKGCSIS